MKSLGPCFPFYLDDFLGGTMHMSAAEVGSYVLLLCEQWRSGFVPTNGTCLARISRQRQTRLAVVLGKFEPCGEGMIRNAKMHAIREERIAYINEQARKGRLSALSRGSTVVQPEGQPEGNPPSASASASAREEEREEKSGTPPQLPDDATTAQIIAFLQASHRSFKALQDIHIASVLRKYSGADKRKVIEAVRTLVVHYAGDADLEMPAPKRLDTYLRREVNGNGAKQPHDAARENRKATGYSISRAIAEERDGIVAHGGSHGM